MVEWIKLIIGMLFVVFGIVFAVTSVLGTFRFKFVLNRMHSAAIGDTLAILFVLLGLVIINGFNFTSLKLLLIIVFLWIASPVSSHLISSLTAMTHRETVLSKCEWIDLDEDEKSEEPGKDA